jgi:hypothetical protein
MENSQKSLLSRFRQQPARHITLIQTDGTVIRTTESAARLSSLIDEALGGQPLEPQSIGQAPVEIHQEDTPPVPTDVIQALMFARKKAS